MKKVTFADEVDVKYIDSNLNLYNQFYFNDYIRSKFTYFNITKFKLLSITFIIMILLIYIYAYKL